MNAAARLLGLSSLVWLCCGPGLGRGQAEELLAAFDQANRLYEQGQFAQAAAAYQRLIDAGYRATTLYYNLGNAWFKAGQLGRAIAAYRHAEQLAPRDPYVRFNLQFARNKVAGRQPPAVSMRERLVAALSLDEWAALAAVGWWVWLGLLCLRELQPDWHRVLRTYTLAAGTGTVLLALLLALAVHRQTRTCLAVVAVPKAAVRSLPWEGKESQVCAHLPEGAEVTVLDERRLSDNDRWVQIGEAGRPLGWVKEDQVIVVRPLAASGRP